MGLFEVLFRDLVFTILYFMKTNYLMFGADIKFNTLENFLVIKISHLFRSLSLQLCVYALLKIY